MGMDRNCYVVDPLSDRRWEALVAEHPLASAFHEPGWLQALTRTYGYDFLVVTTAAPGEAMRNGIVLARVSSRWTGTRLVSLPFSDHCSPLVSNPEELARLLERVGLEAEPLAAFLWALPSRALGLRWMLRRR